MKILMINKFLYPRGGAETYALQLGKQLQSMGHEVQYFGMDHPSRTVGNSVNAYTTNMDFHGGSVWSKITYPAKVLYSGEARRKIRRVLDDFQPEICHLNNFNYQLTPSIILEIRKWERQTGHTCRIIYTAHDPQLVCPNHMCMNPNTHKICRKCLGGKYRNCVQNKCIHGSWARSLLGTLESTLWHKHGVYAQLDTIVCCSHFLKTLLDKDPVLSKKTVVLHNFVDVIGEPMTQKKDYVLYFGRYSVEKGIASLIQAASQLPQIPFVFAGTGPLEELAKDVPNIRNVGFQTGEQLATLIREARFTVLPSECYENCPFSVLESISYGTPVLGANIGGIPELIIDGVTGKLFTSGDLSDLKAKLQMLWLDEEIIHAYTENCKQFAFDTKQAYAEKIIRLYMQLPAERS